MTEQEIKTMELERELKAAKEQLQMLKLETEHLVNSIPGGVAVYDVIADNKFVPVYISEGVPALSGYTMHEYKEKIKSGIYGLIYEPDRSRVIDCGKTFFENGEVLDVTFRIRRKDGVLDWIHLNGKRINTPSGRVRFFAVFTGMWAESLLYQTVANETADGIYVLDRENFELLYANKTALSYTTVVPQIGQTCHYALHGENEPCDFCPLINFGADGREHEISHKESGRTYTSRFHEANWNGIPAYIQYVHDVTEEVKVRREKERLELYCQTLIQSLPGGVAVIRLMPDGSVTPEYISEGFSVLLGMSPNETFELYREDIFAGIHPDDLEINKARIEEFAKKGSGECEFNVRFMRGDGSYIWVCVRTSVQEASDKTRRMYCIYTDISRSVEENELLRNRYENLILQHYRTPDADELILGHCNITQDTLIQIKDFTNSNLSKNPGDFNSRNHFFTVISNFIEDSEERKAFLDTFLTAPALSAFYNKETEKIQTCFMKFPGKPAGCYAKIKMNLVSAPDTGDITGILTISDITDSIISDRILHQLSVTTHDYIVDVNLFTDVFKVLSYNEKASRLPKPIDCHSERIAYMADAVVLPKDRKLYIDALSSDNILKRLKKLNSYTVTYSLYDEAGYIRTKNMTVFTIDLRLGRVCLVCTDITDSVCALENALELAKAGSKAKSEFLTTMSHDIRTPMNAIMGMTTLALAYPDDKNKVKNCLQKIETANKHLLSLVNDVLDMSRIENSDIAINLRPLSLSRLIDEISTIIEPQAKNSGLTFTVKKDNIKHDAFCGDSLRINQILINLLSNAVKFTLKNGKVELIAEEIPPASTVEHVRYRFTIRDTGIGMSKEFLSHIFEPFIRENSTSYIEGTGLGLSITKGLVDKMGGTIEVSSHLDKGSEFVVELEFEIEESCETLYEESHAENDIILAQKPFFGRCFLVAEDHPINAELLCQLLVMDGAEVKIAVNGAEAVDKFSHAAPGTYDAILIDIQMPVMTGYEAARVIREMEHADAKTIPIVAMTANAFAEDVQASMDAGMNAHVSKPIELDVLRSTLNRILPDI